MPRLSIDITSEQHQRLKAIAALKGQSIKDYVLDRTLEDVPELGEMTEEEALRALSDVLAPRLEQVRQGQFSELTAEEIRQKAMRNVGL